MKRKICRNINKWETDSVNKGEWKKQFLPIIVQNRWKKMNNWKYYIDDK